MAGIDLRSPAGTAGSSAPALVPTATKTSAYTAAANDLVPADTTTAGFTITLPTSPAAGAQVGAFKTDGTANVLTVAPAGGGTIDGDPTATVTSRNFGATFEHLGSNAWKIVAIYSGGGSNGVDGKTVRSGAGAPASGLGTDGDFYIDTTAHAIYGPKTAGAWGSSTSLVGSAGSAGTNGAISQLQDEGTNLTVRPTINFVGAGVTATDDAANTRTLVTIPGGGGGSSIVTVVKASTQTLTSNTTLQNDADLSFSGAANSKYIIDILLAVFYDTDNTGDIKVALTLPTGATCRCVVEGLQTTETVGPYPLATRVLGYLTASGGTVAAGNLSNITAPVRITGVVAIGSTAGTVNLQWAQNTSDTNTLQVLTNSYLRSELVA